MRLGGAWPGKEKNKIANNPMKKIKKTKIMGIVLFKKEGIEK